MPDANLYLDRIELERYLSTGDCTKCGASSCKDLVEALRCSRCSVEDLALGEGGAARARALGTALGLDGVLPAVPSIPLPQPIDPGLVELNGASRDSSAAAAILVTGNSTLTQEVLLAVMATASKPFYILFTDTRGDTLDMAIILGSFTPERVARAISGEQALGRARESGSPLVVPGLAASMRDGILSATGFGVEVGPVCAAELPLYFGDKW